MYVVDFTNLSMCTMYNACTVWANPLWFCSLGKADLHQPRPQGSQANKKSVGCSSKAGTRPSNFQIPCITSRDFFGNNFFSKKKNHQNKCEQNISKKQFLVFLKMLTGFCIEGFAVTNQYRAINLYHQGQVVRTR